MRIPFRARSIFIVAVFASAGTAAARTQSATLLNTVEVRQLVSRGAPADNARLSAHFTAVADRFAAEARRHIAMSQSFAGNPSKGFGGGMSVHCKALASLNTQSEKTARELASYHSNLAGGIAATPPVGGTELQAGAGAPEPTEKELTALAAKATTAAEHHALEEYFQMLAKRYAGQADEHVALAQAYRGTKLATAAVHHDHLAKLARDESKEATKAAQMHQDLAGVGR